jgi:hypothetical protein
LEIDIVGIVVHGCGVHVVRGVRSDCQQVRAFGCSKCVENDGEIRLGYSSISISSRLPFPVNVDSVQAITRNVLVGIGSELFSTLSCGISAAAASQDSFPGSVWTKVESRHYFECWGVVLTIASGITDDSLYHSLGCGRVWPNDIGIVIVPTISFVRSNIKESNVQDIHINKGIFRKNVRASTRI